ncbi:MAG: hypothetical protein RLZZ128_47, partial [Actinomycetota bacterium]
AAYVAQLGLGIGGNVADEYIGSLRKYGRLWAFEMAFGRMRS